MNQYNSVSAFDAHHIGLLAAIRAQGTALTPPEELWSADELLAWQDGVAEGCAIRSEFEPGTSAYPLIFI